MRRRFLHLLIHPAVRVATSSNNIMIKVTIKTVAINNTRSFAKKKHFFRDARADTIPEQEQFHQSGSIYVTAARKLVSTTNHIRENIWSLFFFLPDHDKEP